MSTENTVENTVVLNFSFTLDETNLILGGLGELPAKISVGLIDKIRLLAATQLQKLEVEGATATNNTAETPSA